MGVVGCDSSAEHFMADDSMVVSNVAEQTGENRATSTIQSVLRYDLGIIDLERGGYFCLPLSRIGLNEPSAIREIRSSCDCVTGRVVNYFSTRGLQTPALRIDIAGEALPASGFGQLSQSGPNTVRPLDLAVEIMRISYYVDRYRFAIHFLELKNEE